MIKTNLDHSLKVQSLFVQEKSKKDEISKSKTDNENKIDTPIAQIKEQIQSGQYKIDLKKTSEKLALNLLGL